MVSTLRNSANWDEVQSLYFQLCRRAKHADRALDLLVKSAPTAFINANRNEIRRLQERARDILDYLNRLEPLELNQKKPKPLQLDVPDDAAITPIVDGETELLTALDGMRADFIRLLDLERYMVSPSARRPPIINIPRPTISPAIGRIMLALIGLVIAYFVVTALLRSWVQVSFDRGNDAMTEARAAEQDAIQAVADAERATAEPRDGVEATAEVTPEVTAEPGSSEWNAARDYWQNAINEFTFVNTFFIEDYRIERASTLLSDSYWAAIALELDLVNWDAARGLARRYVEAEVDSTRAQLALRNTYYVPALALYNDGDYPGVRAMLDEMPRAENGELDSESEQLYQTSLVTEASTLAALTPTDWAAVETLLLPILERPRAANNTRALDLIGLSLVSQSQSILDDDANESRWADTRAKLERMRTEPLSTSSRANDAINLYRSTYYLPAAALLEADEYLEARTLFEELFALPEGGETYLDALILYRDTYYQPIEALMASGDYTQARAELTAFVALDAENESHRSTRRLLRESYYLPAQQAVEEGEWETALELLQPLYEIDPNFGSTVSLITNTYFQLGRAAIDRSELAQARSYLESLRAINPEFRELETLLSQVYYDLAQAQLAATTDLIRWENARPYLDDLYTLNPNFSDTYTLLQESYYAPLSAQITAAVAQQNSALCIDTREQFFAVREIRGVRFLQDYRDAAWLEHESYYCEVVTSIAVNDMDSARTALLTLSSLSPYFRDIESLFNQTYYLPARAALDASDWMTVRDLLNVLLTRETFYNDAFILLRESYYRPGRAAFEAGDWTTARAELIPLVYGVDGAAPIDPNYLDSFAMLRDAYYMPGTNAVAVGDWQTARGHFLPLLFALDTPAPIAPDYGDVQELIRECYRQPALAALDSGQWEQARAELRPLLVGTATLPAIDPNYADVQEILRESYYRPAAAALEAGEWERVREYLRPLLFASNGVPAIDPNYRDAQTLLRESYYRPAAAALEAGEWERVREYLRPLLFTSNGVPAIDPNYRDAQTLLRESYYQPGSIAFAQRDWETARGHLRSMLNSVTSNYRDATYLLRQSYYIPARIALNGQNWAVARANLDALFNLDPEFLSVAVLRYQAFFVPGQIALEAEDWNLARLTLDGALNRAPDQATRLEVQALINESWYRPGVQALADENWVVARTYLESISLIGYQDARSLYRSTFIHPIEGAISRGDFQAARRALAEFRQAFPSDFQYRTLLLTTYTESLQRAIAVGDWYSAAEQYVQLQAQNPTDAELDLVVAEYGELRQALAQRSASVWESLLLANSGQRLRQLTSVSSLEITSGGRRLVVGDVGGLIAMWTIGSSSPDYYLYTGGAAVTDLALDERSNYLALAVANDVQIWDLEGGQFLRTLTGTTGRLNNLAISADGAYLAAASADGTIYLWTPTDWTSEPLVLTNDMAVTALTFSPDGVTLAAGLASGEIVLWNIADQAITGRTPSVAYVREIIFHPDGHLFVSVGNESQVRVWNLNAESELVFNNQHTDWVRDVAFNGDGSLMATVGADRRLILWDLAAGRSVNHLEGISGDLLQVDFSADSSFLVIGTGNGDVILWSVRGESD